MEERRIPIESVDVGEVLPPDSITRTETRTENREELLSRLRIEEKEAEHKRVEAAKEAQHRRAMEEKEVTHRYRTFWSIFAVLIIAGVGSVAVMLIADSPENQEFGRSAATAVVGALVGYFGGSMVNLSKKG